MKIRSLVPLAVVIGAALAAPAPTHAAACTHVDGLVPLHICVPPTA